MPARTIPVDDFDLVLFGATGDLAARKIIPSLFRRFVGGQMPDAARLIGAARTELSDDDFRGLVREALDEFLPGHDADAADRFAANCHYVPTDAKGDKGWDRLAEVLRDGVVRAFYFSVGPSIFADLAAKLKATGLTECDSRLVVEKPFGHDLDSARALNETLLGSFPEERIFRIDHFLGKETVQNLMAVRFANVLFEPLWNQAYVDHVQITVSETLGVDGRGAYYDRAGALRDMVQNHLMQLLCLTAMEPPAQLDADMLRAEKTKAIRALEPVGPKDVVRGQYKAGPDGPAYAADAEVDETRTESFVALRVGIANWRWSGVPFYLRTGKRMAARRSEIVVQFRDPPHSLFADAGETRPNALVIRLQPDEGIDLAVTIKEPGPGGMRLRTVPLDMTFAEALGDSDIPDAYERLIMDVIRGDRTLFMGAEEVEAAWAWTDPIVEAWEEADAKPHPYAQGSAGPEEAHILLHSDGRRWRELEPDA